MPEIAGIDWKQLGPVGGLVIALLTAFWSIMRWLVQLVEKKDQLVEKKDQIIQEMYKQNTEVLKQALAVIDRNTTCFEAVRETNEDLAAKISDLTGRLRDYMLHKEH
jgi:mevalonate kinase